MSSQTADLKYRRNWQLRSELVGIVKPERRHEYGPAVTGICKADLLAVCDHVGLEYEDTPTLERMYHDLCDVAGTERSQASGQEWALRRPTLKALVTIAGNEDASDGSETGGKSDDLDESENGKDSGVSSSTDTNSQPDKNAN